jgi:hypothetical protein
MIHAGRIFVRSGVSEISGKSTITGLIVGLAFGLNGRASSSGESTEAPTLVPVQD